VRPGDAARPKTGAPAVRGTASASAAAEAPLESPRARVHGRTGGSFGPAALGPHADADSAARVARDGAGQDGARHGMTLRTKGAGGSRLAKCAEEGPRTARASAAAADGARRNAACAAVVTPRAKTARAVAVSDGRWR
jgi:hypothetical protein